MIVFRLAASLDNYTRLQKEKGHSIGFVPTMGALHQGHLSLVQRCKQETDIAVCSIFINPTQFNDPADLKKYPRTIEADILKLEQAKCDVLFIPGIEEMYPPNRAAIHYELGNLENDLEGMYRPGHFQGVCQAVHRLTDIVKPHKIFFGQKDFQQCLVIKRLFKNFQIPSEIVVNSTIREPSGLAMSSRNMRLTDEEREKATAIYKALINIKNNFTSVPFDKLVSDSTSFLLQHGFSKVDYIAICDANTLQPVSEWNGSQQLAVLIAAFINNVRLIDNMMLTDE